MKVMMFILCLSISGWVQASEWKQLPEAKISSEALGGTILMLQMKYTLVINDDEQQAITNEIGEETREQLFRAMIMDVNPNQIEKEFSRADRPATSILIMKYAETIGSPPSLSLN